MFSRGLVPAFLCFLVIVISVVPAHAANVTLFTNRAAFIAASSNLQNITFEGIAPPGNVSPPLASLTLLGVTFSDSPGNVFVVDSAFFAPTFAFGSGASLNGGTGITAVLPAGITALGSDVMTALGNGPFQIVLSTGDTFLVPTGSNGVRNFAGFISDIPISSIRFNRTAGTPLFDNFVFGQAVAAVPEPRTLVLMGTGLAALAIRARKKQLRI